MSVTVFIDIASTKIKRVQRNTQECFVGAITGDICLRNRAKRSDLFKCFIDKDIYNKGKRESQKLIYKPKGELVDAKLVGKVFKPNTA